jgi:hypothetical protein
VTLLRYSWAQPCCSACFTRRLPTTAPKPVSEQTRKPETCCDCGIETTEGIYTRVDPETVRFPTAEDD